MTNLILICTILLILFLVFCLSFIICRAKKNFGLIDIVWPLSFWVIVTLCVVFSPKISLNLIIIFGLISLWAIRLTRYLYVRNIGRPEDFRYSEMRKSYGEHANINAFFKIFMLQYLLSFLIGSTFLFTLNANPEFSYIDYLWIIIAFKGFAIEAIADWQVTNFKKTNGSGTFLSSGLWKYSRHPNYFGEAMFWLGIGLLGHNWLSMLGPIGLTLLLRFVSGVPMLEVKYKDNLDYQIYKSKTNAFIPWFPKQNS